MSSERKEGAERTVLVTGIVLTHGTMCHGMVDAVQKIAGAPEGALRAVSNDGRGPDELFRAVGEAAGSGPALIFTDMQTGSCALAARFACRHPESRRVICGANLPMLLDFVFHREQSLDELVPRLVERGRAAIRPLEPASAGDEHRTASGG